MWLLRHDEKGLIYRITPGKRHIVTRKDGDLLLVGDQSISRKHAEIFVDEENEDKGITVKDLGSKYGTFTVVGEGDMTQLPSNEQITLKSDDIVKFGIQWNSWRVEFVPLLVATSTLTQKEKGEVKQLVTQLGGQVVNQWQESCTHLTMNQITVTVKVVCALAAGIPIVSPEYWKSFTEALSSMQSTLPNHKDFLPPLAETVLNPAEVSFFPNPVRSKVFDGCTFVASTPKQLLRIKPMITTAGGQVVEFCGNTWSETKFLEDKTILMQHSVADKQGSQQSQIPDGYIPVARKLKALGIRCIPESEIGLSVLYCSMEHYCNPRYVQSLLCSSSLEATQPVNVICPNTQDSLDSNHGCIENTTGPSRIQSKKRGHENVSEDEDQPTKRSNTGCNSEDLFGSQNTKDGRMNENWGKISSSLKNSKVPSVTSSNDSKSKPPIINPSLDMFAPSGERTNILNGQNLNNVKPSCEDIFASSGSKRTEGSTKESNEACVVLNKSSRIQGNNINDDDFSFKSRKKSSNQQSKETGAIDDFSFVSRKRGRTPEKVMEAANDEFSFTSSRKSKCQEEESEKDDVFSFRSNKKTRKTERQSNPDMFASSAESSSCNGNNCSAESRGKKLESNEASSSRGQKSLEDDDLFAFPGNPLAKRKRNNQNFADPLEADMGVPVAVLQKKDLSVGSSCEPNENESNINHVDFEDKNLVTYSKTKLPLKETDIKLEPNEEEIDELAKEFQNATVIVVKPLVVVREKQINSTFASTGKNFKKFHKVVGINKRVVPHIIGGSDLVPHENICQPSDDFLLPPSPPQVMPDEDDWDFPNDRIRKKR